MIRCVTFDWWHTIAETPWPDYDTRMRRLRIRAVREALDAEGLVVDEVVLYEAYDRLTDHLVERWNAHADLAPREQVDLFLRFAHLDDGFDMPREKVEEAFGTAILEHPPILFPRIATTLARLKAEGYRIGLVSNTGRTWGRFLRPLQDDLGIGEHFDVRVFSDEVGARKPESAIFEAALEGLRLRPTEAVHVGDDVEADIRGAKRLGLRAVWFNTGFWPGARGDEADAEIRDHAELFDVLARWKR